MFWKIWWWREIRYAVRAHWRHWLWRCGLWPDVRLRDTGRLEINGYRPPLEAWRRIVENDKLCSYCDRMAQSIDHVVPRSQGGNEQQLTAACFACNGQKRDMPLLVFMAMRASGRLARVPRWVDHRKSHGAARVRNLKRAASRAVVTGQFDAALREQLIRAGIIRPEGS